MWEPRVALQQHRRKGLQAQLAEIDQQNAKLRVKVVENEMAGHDR